MMGADLRILLAGFDPAGRDRVAGALGPSSPSSSTVRVVDGNGELGPALASEPADLVLVCAPDGDQAAVATLRSATGEAWLVVVQADGTPDDHAALCAAGADDVVSEAEINARALARWSRAAIARRAERVRLAAHAAAFDNSRQAFVVVDRECRVLAVNELQQAWTVAIMGRRLRVGEIVYDVLPAEVVPAIRARFEQALAGERVTNVREYRPRVGDPRWFEIQYEPFSAPDGLVAGVLVASIDITERVRAQAAADARERELRAIIDYTHDWESWIGPDGRLIWVSSAVERMTGYSPDECQQIAGYPLPLVHPEDRGRFAAIVFEERVERGNDESFRLLRRDGAVFWGSVSWLPVYNPEGHSLGHRLSVRDITARMEAEQAGQAREDRLRTLFEHAALGIFQYGIDGRLISVNHTFARLLGYGSADGMMAAVSRMSDDVYARPGAGEEVLAAARGTPGAARVETQLRHVEGRQLTVNMHVRLVRDERDREMYLEGFAEDVTDRKRADDARRELETRLQQVQKLESLAVLAGGVAHDFNNLLMVILGNASLALMEMAESDPSRASVRHIEQSARRAAELTGQMLAYSGGGRFLLRPLDVSHVIADMQQLVAASLPKNAILLYDLKADVPEVRADGSQLRQVILNLLTNAAEALDGAPGTITVRTGSMQADRDYLAHTYLDDELPPGPYVFIEVRDTGKGMDADTRSRLFEPFFTTKFTGRGLGLAAVIGIVRAHRGAIRVESFPGHGSTFRILLPAEAAHVAAVAPKAAPRPRPDGRPGRVLVVDDDALVRHVTRTILEKAGYVVETAGDGVDALQLFEAHPAEIDVVLLDLTMPRMDGPATFARLRAIRPDTPIVLSSGYSEEQVSTRFSDPGIAGFVQKPYRPEDLLAKLREVLATT